jgi:hypothetical protein
MGSIGSIINYKSHYYCTGPNGLILIQNIKNFDQFYASCDPGELIRIVKYKSVFGTLGAVAFLVCCYLVYKYWWRIRYYWWFLVQQRIKREERTQNNLWLYDAYILYCAEDRFWVHGTFMKHLEKEYGFRLCIQYRDFLVGANIPDTIAEKMSESREIIIILSEIVLERNWCHFENKWWHFELDSALLQSSSRNKSLITITPGDIENYCLDPKIAHLLDSHTCLRWFDHCINEDANKLFWKKLVARMYNDPCRVSCCYFFPYDASSLGHTDIIAAKANDDYTVYTYQVNYFSNIS